VLVSPEASSEVRGRLVVTITDALGARHIGVAGELDAESTFSLTPAIAEFEGDVVVDLAAVSFVDSTAMRVLLLEHDRFVREGRVLHVINPSRAVARILHLLAADRLLGSDG
jgi:anti-anti-sigma factor